MSGSNQVVWDATHPSKKSLKMDLANDEDRISNLPDSLICHILSRLPTKDAFRTCILSKDWEYKWTYNCNFDIFHFINEEEQVADYVNFVERVLRRAHYIRCFKLIFPIEYGMSRLASWISSALRHKIKTLDLTIYYPYWVVEKGNLKDDDAVCFLNSSSLRKLSIDSPFFPIPAVIILPNLTSLYFHNVRILNESSNTSHVKYTFPVLKTLELVKCKWLKVKLVEIHAPELTKFCSIGDTGMRAEDDDGYSIKVIGDKLEVFESECDLPDEAIVTGSRVVDASFTFRDNGPTDGGDEFSREKGLQVLRLLKGFSGLMSLYLTNSMVEAMRNWRQQFRLPKFVKLAQLHLTGPVYSEGLLELLHAAPYLKILFMIVKKKVSWNDDYDFDAVEYVPSCVVSHLEEVTFSYCDEPQYRLAKFLLGYGKELKKLFMFCGLAHDDVLEKLSAFPKVSTSVAIITNYDTDSD